jgi:hypothetical protein
MAPIIVDAVYVSGDNSINIGKKVQIFVRGIVQSGL